MTDTQLIIVSVICTTIVMFILMEWRIRRLVNDILDDLDERDHALADNLDERDEAIAKATGTFVNMLLHELQKGLSEELEKLKTENDGTN